MTDRELLHQFAASGDQEAFASLVARHGGMVHAAAARIAGRSDADDAAQAVFVLLARKAHRLGGYEVRGNEQLWEAKNGLVRVEETTDPIGENVKFTHLSPARKSTRAE
jgi:hypothetical protein